MNIVEKISELNQELATGEARTGKNLKIKAKAIEEYANNEDSYNKTNFDFGKLATADLEKIAEKIKGQIDKSVVDKDYSFIKFLNFSLLTKTEKKALRKKQLAIMEAELEEENTSIKTKLLAIIEDEA